MDQNINFNNDLFADGGFPHIKICVTETIEDKTKKEFSSKNIMSIQNILDKRRNILTNRQIKQPLPSRTVNIPTKPIENVDSESIVFNLKMDDILADISNLDVSRSLNVQTKILKQKRSKGSKSKSSKSSKKSKSKGSIKSKLSKKSKSKK